MRSAATLFVSALESLPLTPEVALAMPAGRALLRAEYERGLRCDTDGNVRFPPGESFRDASITAALDAMYPVPMKRVRNEFTTKYGVCWFERDLWMTQTEGDIIGYPNAVGACAALGGTDADYKSVLKLRDVPEVVVALDDPRDAIV